MVFKRFYDEGLAHSSYLVGCPESGESVLIGPYRLFDRYESAAESEGLRITHVTETHIHAHYLSGSRELDSQDRRPSFPLSLRRSRLELCVAQDLNAVLLRIGQGCESVSDIRGGITAWKKAAQPIIV